MRDMVRTGMVIIKGRLPLLGLLAGLAICLTLVAAPRRALAAEAVTVPGDYESYSQAVDDGKTNIILTNGGSGISIASGITVTVSGGRLDMSGCTNAGTLSTSGSGTITGDFLNTGTVSGSCTGIIYNTGSASGGTVYVLASASAIASASGYIEGGVNGTAYYDLAAYGGGYWIPQGRRIDYLIINGYICTADGGKIAHNITYLYNNATQSAMQLDTSAYPAVYYVKMDSQDIPAPPDTEVDYVFAGWYCMALGYDETNLQKTLTIPGGTSGDLTLISYWTESKGHNQGLSRATTGMTAGGGMSGGGGMGSAMGAATSALSAFLNGDDEEDEEEAVVSLVSNTGSMRVRTATATTRHSIINDAGLDVQALASQSQRSSRFPWQWVGIGLGAAVAIAWLGYLIKKRNMEKTAAIYEKLNIHD